MRQQEEILDFRFWIEETNLARADKSDPMTEQSKIQKRPRGRKSKMKMRADKVIR
jgi:hypothetical protein